MIVPRFRRVAVLAVTGVAALGLTGCSHTVTDAATITYRDSSGSHTIDITRADYEKQLGALVGDPQFQTFLKSNNFPMAGDQKSTTGTEISTSYLGQLVDQSAIDAEFASLKLTITSDMRSTAEKETKQEFALSNEISQDASGNQTFVGPGAVYASFPKWLQSILVDRAARVDAIGRYYTASTPAKEQALYKEFASTICPSGRFVAQIQVPDAATANAILVQLQAGASFADLAKAKSKDATSAKDGGTVGCLSERTVAKEFETAAYAAPFGVPVGPVKSNLGYHVILVSHPTYAAVRTELTQALQQNPLIARDLRLQSMHVWINPRFGSGALAVDSQQGSLIFHVSAPKTPTARVCREGSGACSGTTTTTTATTLPTAPQG
jgi:hypothetical protein